MKKITWSVVIIYSLLMICLYSCKPTTKEGEKDRVKRVEMPNPIVWDTIEVNKTELVKVNGDSIKSSLSISLVVPIEYKEKEVIGNVSQKISLLVFSKEGQISENAIEAYASDYLDKFKKDAQATYKKWKKYNLGKVLSYSKNIESEVLYNKASLISYQIRITEQKEDDIAIIDYQNILFDLTSGKALEEKDIFRDNFQEGLNKVLVEQLKRIEGKQTVEELQEAGYWGAGDIASNNNFYVDENGITYTFNPGEYADPQLGVLKVFINYEDLLAAGILKSDSPISLLFSDIKIVN